MGDYKNLKAAYEMATLNPYGYLIIDTHPNCPKNLQYRSNIFKGEDCVAYMPK